MKNDLGGKSYLGCQWIATSCVRFPGIRAGLARKTLKSLKASTFNTLMTILKEEWGLVEDEHFNMNSNTGELLFWNGSKIILMEMATLPSDPTFSRFGSSEFTIIFADEIDQLDMRAVDVAFSRIRWLTHKTFKVSKMLLSTNPSTNWVRDRFVQTPDGEPVVTRKYEKYIPFSLFDNPDPEFRATYEASLRMMSEAEKQRLLYGNWDYVDSNDAAFYRGFDGSKHLESGLKDRVYDKNKPLILSFDFNCHPFMTCLVSQVDYEKREIYFIEEILGHPKHKRNNTPALSKFIFDKYRKSDHKDMFIVSGDPAGLARDSRVEEGVNQFTIIRSALTGLHTSQRLLKTQPPQTLRGEWINEVLENELDGWKIIIDLKCRKLTDDLIYQLSEEDGSKDKSKVRDPITGVKYERYGHVSDCFDYTLCLFLQKDWYKYKRGGNTVSAPTSARIAPTFEY